MSILSEPHFHNEEAAYARLEAIVWPHGPVCPHCGNADPARVYAIKGKTARIGLRTCAECREQFRVTVGTVFEKSKVPLHKWFQAAHLLTSSKKGISSHQLHRTLKVTYKTAWFMAHRLREAMRIDGLGALGGDGGVVEADETYFGKTAEPRVSPQRKGRPYSARGSFGPRDKRAIVALVERGGNVRTFHVAHADKMTVAGIVRDNIAKESRLHTDESQLYPEVGATFEAHETVKHSAEEYVRYKFTWGEEGPKTEKVHTNSAEGYFSIFKRGMRGVYQHCGERHLHRYLAEFDFRYNNRSALGVEDTARATKALSGIVGKRLTYRDSSAGRP